MGKIGIVFNLYAHSGDNCENSTPIIDQKEVDGDSTVKTVCIR